MPILKKTWVQKDPEDKLKEVMNELDKHRSIPYKKRTAQQHRKIHSLDAYRYRLLKRIEGGVGVWGN
jgi:hypothetical protein